MHPIVCSYTSVYRLGSYKVRIWTKRLTSEKLDEEEVVIDVDEPQATIRPSGVGPATAEKLRDAGFDDLLP